MTGRDPAEFGWWLASRASGIVALALITLSVTLGLAMAGKVARRPGLPRVLMAVHEHSALAGLIAIAVHGITLLGDRWLHPGPVGVAVPFAMEYRPLWTGLGIVAGYLAAALGLSFYARKRIGTKRWRSLHKLTILVYVLGVAHAVGAGTDADTAWMRAALVMTGAPVLFLFTMRVVPREKEATRTAGATGPAGTTTPRTPTTGARPPREARGAPA